MKNLSAAELKTYMDRHHESDYLLIDVRQAFEYAEKHIPGARLQPLPELEPNIFNLPSDRDLLFYCHSGGRSMAAAFLTAEAEVTEKTVYNLEGGIMAWQGKTLSDFPRVQLFDASETLSQVLMIAMNLEKGAYRFYRQVMERFPKLSIAAVVEKLSKAESAHAEMVYGFWKRGETDPEPFETVWNRLPGDIIEGGETLEAAIARLDNPGDNLCLNLIDLSLHIEYSAFDLYRTLAGQSQDEAAGKAFLTIAQAEKRHMHLLTGAIDQC